MRRCSQRNLTGCLSRSLSIPKAVSFGGQHDRSRSNPTLDHSHDDVPARRVGTTHTGDVHPMRREVVKRSALDDPYDTFDVVFSKSRLEPHRGSHVA